MPDISTNASGATADANFSPELTQKLHLNADTNQGPSALHHRLGSGPNDAAPGNHKHPVALTYDAASLPDGAYTQALTSGTYNDIISTADLAVGKWLIDFGCLVYPRLSAYYDVTAFAGSGVMTLTGNRVAEFKNSISYPFHLHLSFIADVTEVGHVTFKYRSSSADTNVAYGVRSQTIGIVPVESGATGYTAVKIA